jgi:hypothetical protein
MGMEKILGMFSMFELLTLILGVILVIIGLNIVRCLRESNSFANAIYLYVSATEDVIARAEFNDRLDNIIVELKSIDGYLLETSAIRRQQADLE